MRLLDIILTLSEQDRHDLSLIAIERNERGAWYAKLSISRMQTAEDQTAIQADVDHLSPNPHVTVTALERVPDQEHPIDIDEINVSESVRAQAGVLQESGLVGRLDLARYDRANRTTGYKIKTHAGSQAERTAWIMRDKSKED